MKKLIVFLFMAALALSVYCQEDDDLYSISPEDFDLYEMYKKNPENIESSPFLKDEQRYDLRLHLFYEVLKSNPYVKGLPDYKKFKSSLQNPEISEGFYNSLRLNENLKHYVPVTYDDFAEVLGLPQKPSENYCDEEYIRLAQEYLRLQEEYRSTSEQQRRYERNRAVIDASSAIIDAITGSMGATIPDRYNQNQYDDEDNYSIYPTIPGTDVRDYNRSGAIIEGNSIYPTIPGTDIRDFNKPGRVIENGVMYQTIPGTNVRDFSKPGIKIERK